MRWLEKETISEKHYGLEEHFHEQKFKRIAGLDEAGRGCLAGPVVAAAVVFESKPESLLYDIRDSKKIAELKRERLFDTLMAMPGVDIGLGIVDAQTIDTMNILRASLHAMHVASEKLKQKPDLCLVDGNQNMPTAIKQYTLIKGDDRSISIGAASIIAKVWRDRMMRNYALEYPEYGFIKNKGYGTKIHREAIAQCGLSDLHRKSFKLKSS